MRKLILIFILLAVSISAQVTISETDSITTWDDELIIVAQKDSSNSFVWRKLMLKDLETLLNDSLSVLPTGSSAQILVADASGNLQMVLMSGEGSMSNTGVFSISTDAVDSTEIADGHVQNYHIKADAGIELSKLASPSGNDAQMIVWDKNGSGDIEYHEITGDITITAAGVTGIASGVIVLGDLASNSVNSAKIVDGAVALADMATNSVNSAKIVNSSITTSDILDATILNGDIAANTITATRIDTGGLQSYNYATESIPYQKLDTDGFSAYDVLYADGTGGAYYSALNSNHLPAYQEYSLYIRFIALSAGTTYDGDTAVNDSVYIQESYNVGSSTFSISGDTVYVEGRTFDLNVNVLTNQDVSGKQITASQIYIVPTSASWGVLMGEIYER